MDIWIVLQLLLALGLFAYFYIRKRYSYWSSRGVSGPRPIFPFGYTWDKARHDPFILETQWLRQYGKIYGVYTGLLPTLIIADPDAIKQVFIKDFGNFANRRSLNSYHSVWNHNMFSVDYDEWKRYRSITAGAFSSGKLKSQNPLIARCIAQLFTKLDSLPSGVFIPKEVFTNFSIDITAATFFATETNANNAKSTEPSPIMRQCIALADIPALKSAAVSTFPRPLLQLMGITSVFREEALAFIVDLLKTMVKQQKGLEREKQNEFIRLLVEGKEDKESTSSPTLTDNEVIAQCLIFFLASYEQIASVMTYCAYELAQNPAIQERLLHNLQAAIEHLDSDSDRFGVFINDVPYLEAVVKESLRRYPPELRMERRVSAEGAKIGSLEVEKDTLIEVPTIALHHNPEYWPNPEKYDPERFMPENKDKLVPYTFLPFGAGPRNCIGTRFGYQVIKLGLAELVLNFGIGTTMETPKKLSFVSGNLSLLIPQFPLKIWRR